MCRLDHLLLCWACACWCSLQLFPDCHYGCDGIDNLPCRGLVQAWIICTHCTSEYTALCIVTTVIGLQCLCWSFLPTVFCLWLHLLLCQNSSGGISPHHTVCQGPLILFHYTCTAAPHWICSCSWMQWGAMLCCSEPCLTLSSYHSFPVEGHSWLLPEVSVSRCRGYNAPENIMHASCLLMFLVLSYKSWYMPFHDHSDLYWCELL